MASMIARVLRLHLACLLLLLLAACASGGGQRVANVSTEPLPPPDTTSASGAYKGANDYRIGAQDLLAISVFGVQELNKEVRVNSNGQISLPLIGGVMAGGKSIPELEAELAKKYADGFLQRPQRYLFVGVARIDIEGQRQSVGIHEDTHLHNRRTAVFFRCSGTAQFRLQSGFVEEIGAVIVNHRSVALQHIL